MFGFMKPMRDGCAVSETCNACQQSWTGIATGLQQMTEAHKDAAYADDTAAQLWRCILIKTW